jgi:uncharacterized membrane protein YgaE (UPF0421/DUF939 family)
LAFFAYSEMSMNIGWIRETGIYVNERSDYEAVNRSLDDVISLLEREIRRLKESLETYRLSNHPNRNEIIRWHVRTLDERQDALERLRAMLLSQRDIDHGPRH